MDVVVKCHAPLRIISMDCAEDDLQCQRQPRMQSPLVQRHPLPMLDPNRSTSTRPPIIVVAVVVPMATLIALKHTESAIIGHLTERVMVVFATMGTLTVVECVPMNAVKLITHQPVSVMVPSECSTEPMSR